MKETNRKQNYDFGINVRSTSQSSKTLSAAVILEIKILGIHTMPGR